MRKPIRAVFVTMAIGVLGAVLLRMNVEGAPETANAYKRLQPGTANIDDVRTAMSAHPLKTEGGKDLRYPSDGNAALNDHFYFRGDRLALVTSASPDRRYLTEEKIFDALGEPESRIWFNTQEFLDYSEQGLRFICDLSGRTTGSLYFSPVRRRIHRGHPASRIDLRRDLPQLPPGSVPPDFRVGAAQVSITPETFKDLTGDRKRKPHLAEELYARAVIFERGQTRIALIGVDVFGMGTWDVAHLKKSLAEEGFENVVFAMSHTHANVDTIGFYGHYPRDYAKHVIKQTKQAVLDAAEKLGPIDSLRVGSVEMPLDGGRVVDLIRNGRDPGIVNPTVSLVQAIGSDGEPIANVIHLACHPEVIRLKNTGGLSPDFVGRLCDDVARVLGGQSVFLNGALGGMLTPESRFRTQAAAEEMGSTLSSYVIQAAHQSQPSSTYDLWMHERPIEYPITAKASLQFLKNSPEPTELHQGRIRSEMNALWIGDAQFITVPGELLPEVGFEIEANMTGRVRAIIGLANGELGYMVPSYDFRAGGYEERTGPGAAGGEITRSVGLELAPMIPDTQQ